MFFPSCDGLSGMRLAMQGCTRGSTLQVTASHGLLLSLPLSVSCLAPTLDAIAAPSYGCADLTLSTVPRTSTVAFAAYEIAMSSIFPPPSHHCTHPKSDK